MSQSDPDHLAKALDIRARAHHAVHGVNRALARRDWSDPVFVAGRAALNGVLVGLAQAKWRLGTHDGTFSDLVATNRSPALLAEAVNLFETAKESSRAIEKRVRDGVVQDSARPALATRGAETLFADDVPLVPSICPIVILKGSNYDMGRQYARQIIDIYGAWIFAQQANRRFSDAEAREIARWKAELKRYTPEVHEFARGWAAGCTAAGLSMSEDHAVAIFTGTRPPADKPSPLGFGFTDGDEADSTMAAYLGMARQKDPVGEDLCSGIAAWGRATSDGLLVAGASTDHDVTYEATIVAFPDDGNAYIYTPFSANGSIPMLGGHFMAGHPGFNAKGMSYVHHAGANTGEPVEQWGYGVRRGPMIFHALQYADTARAAERQQMGYPVGDTAISVGSGNGLFADDREGYAVEGRAGAPDHAMPIVRTHSYDAYGVAYDFLYANNNALDPRSGHMNAPPAEGYRFSIAGGWHTFDPKALDASGGGAAMRRVMAKSSEARNRYAYRAMMDRYGAIDADYMTMVYRQSGEAPEGEQEELERRYAAGEQWNSSVAGRHNAHVAVIKPNDANGGFYRACIGAADRASEVKDPGHGYTLYDETNTFWELRLKDSPEEVVAAAADQARMDFAEAASLHEKLPADHAGRAALQGFLDLASASAERGRSLLATGKAVSSDDLLATLARAVRAFTVAQVRARQVIEAIRPPPATLADYLRTVAARAVPN